MYTVAAKLPWAILHDFSEPYLAATPQPLLMYQAMLLGYRESRWSGPI